MFYHHVEELLLIIDVNLNPISSSFILIVRHNFPLTNVTRASRSIIYLIFISINTHATPRMSYVHKNSDTERFQQDQDFWDSKCQSICRYADETLAARSGKSGLFSPKSHQVIMSPLPFEDQQKNMKIILLVPKLLFPEEILKNYLFNHYFC